MRRETDHKEMGSVCFVDLSKAYDTLGHKITRTKIENNGLGDKLLEILTSLLWESSPLISENGVQTKQQSLGYGVPQGSVPGPFLLSNTNDLPNV